MFACLTDGAAGSAPTGGSHAGLSPQLLQGQLEAMMRESLPERTVDDGAHAAEPLELFLRCRARVVGPFLRRRTPMPSNHGCLGCRSEPRELTPVSGHAPGLT